MFSVTGFYSKIPESLLIGLYHYRQPSLQVSCLKIVFEEANPVYFIVKPGYKINKVLILFCTARRTFLSDAYKGTSAWRTRRLLAVNMGKK